LIFQSKSIFLEGEDLELSCGSDKLDNQPLPKACAGKSNCPKPHRHIRKIAEKYQKGSEDLDKVVVMMAAER
jgi:hypothetical protein